MSDIQLTLDNKRNLKQAIENALDRFKMQSKTMSSRLVPKIDLINDIPNANALGTQELKILFSLPDSISLNPICRNLPINYFILDELVCLDKNLFLAICKEYQLTVLSDGDRDASHPYIRLYRGDTRDPQTIFSEGFQCRKMSFLPNYKGIYVNEGNITGNVGISTSRASNTATDHSQDKNSSNENQQTTYTYKIEIPKSEIHKYGAVDVGNSQQEVNFILDIPKEYIYSVTSANGVTILNNKYDSSYSKQPYKSVPTNSAELNLIDNGDPKSYSQSEITLAVCTLGSYLLLKETTNPDYSNGAQIAVAGLLSLAFLASGGVLGIGALIVKGLIEVGRSIKQSACMSCFFSKPSTNHEQTNTGDSVPNIQPQ